MKILKRIALILFIIIVLLIGFGIGFAMIYEEEIIEAVISEVNQQIDTEIQIKEINFSVIKKFPMACIECVDVYVKSSNLFPRDKPKDDTLAFIDHLYLEMKVSDIIKKKYNLKEIELKDGLIFMQKNKKGNTNFNITQNKETNEKSKFNIKLKKVVLKNIHYQFYNKKTKSIYCLYAKKYSISGQFSEKEYTISSNGDLFLDKLKQNNINYLVYPKTKINVNVKVKDNQIDVTSGKLWLGKENLNITGFYNWSKKGSFNITAQSQKLGIKNLTKYLPKSYTKWTQIYQAQGIMAFWLNISQDMNKKKVPHLSIKTDITKARIFKKSSDISIDDINLSLKFDDHSKKIDIKQFEAKINESYINGNAQIKLLNNPKIKTNLVVESNLHEIQEFLDLKTIETINGKIKADISLVGTLSRVDSICKQDIDKMHLNGTVDIENSKIIFNDKKHTSLKIFKAKTQLQNKHIIADNIKFKLNNTNGDFNGKAYNIIPHILFHGEKLRLNGNLSCDSINLNEYITETKSSQNDNSFSLPQEILARLNINIQHLSKDKFIVSEIQSGFYINDTCIQLAPFKAKVAHGLAKGKAFLSQKLNKQFKLSIKTNTQDINISKLMYQFDNFEQKNIEYKHIDGNLYATTQFNCLLNPKLELDVPSITINSDIEIHNGKLNHYEPLYKLSHFISLKELEGIRFETLKNSLKIKNNTLYIPNMQVYSNALNLKLSGEHCLKGNYTYHLNILLSELLGRKARANKQENQTYGVVEDDGYGKTSLFIKIDGDEDDIKFKYDTKSVKEHIKEEFKSEKKELKNILKEEFGLFKKDTTVKAKPKQKKTTKDQFQIEWND